MFRCTRCEMPFYTFWGYHDLLRAKVYHGLLGAEVSV
jgi:hypothetical protein